MNRRVRNRTVIVAKMISSSFVLLASLVLSTGSALAQKSTLGMCCWVDVKTGKRVATAPIAGVNISGVIEHAENGVAIVSPDGKTAFNPKTKQNYAKEPDGCWVDVKTGKRVTSVPLAGVNISGVIERAEN